MGVAVLKYRLYDLDLVIKKTIVFAILVLLLLALAGLGALLLAGSLVPSLYDRLPAPAVRSRVRAPRDPRLPTGEEDRRSHRLRRPRIPVRSALASSPNGRRDVFDRGRLAAHGATDRPGDRSGRGAGVAQGRLRVAPGGRLAGRGDREPVTALSRSASCPTSGTRPSRSAIRARLLGALTLEMRANDPMNPSKERIVRDLASQAGLVLRNVRLIEELRESRRRIVDAQDEGAEARAQHPRRRAAAARRARGEAAGSAERLVPQEPAKAAAMLDELQDATDDALENLRDLARGIYPPLLADQGLAAALEGAGPEGPPVPVAVVEPDGIGRYPAEIEAAVYFSCLEALQNVAKYAEATTATVRLGAATNGELRFEVSDDGRGFDPASRRHGTGLQGIADRLAALGGSSRSGPRRAKAPRWQPPVSEERR